jgi:hypothetical protein
MGLECSAERPWGLHGGLRNDGDCPRCGWTAPGPAGDARLDAIEALEAAAGLDWGALSIAAGNDGGEALAA